MSRITLRVGLSRSTHSSISSLGHRPLTYLNPHPFSFSVGERKLMKHFVERTMTSLDSMTVPVRTYRLLDGAGSLLWEEPVAYRFVSWGSLYRALLSEFGRERYLQGAALVGFSQDGHGVDLRFASGQQLRYVVPARP